MQLYLLYIQILDENEEQGGRLWEIYDEEIQCMYRAMQTERKGITVRNKTLYHLIPIYEKHRDRYAAQIDNQSPSWFTKPSSLAQLKRLFIEGKKYDTVERTKPSKTFREGQPKIDGTQLAIWRAEHKDTLCNSIIEWKASSKAVRELENYDFFLCKDNGRYVIHPRWRPTGAKTGRFSCADPNLMQMTNFFSGRRRATLETRQRECFGPGPGRVWYAIDYSQIEVWIFSYFSQEKAMIEMLRSGHDFHTSTARKAFGHHKTFTGDPNNENDEAYKWRRRAKLVFFSRLYGGGVRRLASLINSSFTDAQTFSDEFNYSFQEVKHYMGKLVRKCIDEGKLVNAFGREYPIDPDWAYKAVNWNIQGSAADVMKRAFIRVWRVLDNWPGSWISATIHDELYIDIPEEYNSKMLLREIVEAMQADSKALGLPVPLPVAIKVIRNHLLGGTKVNV